MSTLLNILIVEDSEDDTLLLLHELRRAGFEPEWKRVETEPDFLAELEQTPDLILSDYSMPQFSGLRAVDLLRERELDIPFILISGTIGEEAAVEAMKHGVTDYLLKDRLGRLGHAIERALDQKKLRDEHNRMQQQLALQATAFQTAANAIIVTDRAGKILWINPAFTQATGYTAAEVLGQTPRVLKSGQHNAEFYRDFWKTILSGQTWRGEFINRRKDGSTYYDEHTVTPVRTSGGAITHFVGIMHDISERKRAEQAWKQSEERFRTLVEDARDIVFTVASDRTIASLNTAFETITGFPRSEWIGREFQQLIHPDDLAAALDIFRRALQNEKPPQFELRLRTKSGDFVTLEFTVTPQLHQGNVSGVMGIGRDVTERQRAELLATVFANLGQRLNLVRTPEEAANIVMDVADELLGWDAFTLDLYSPEKDRIHHVRNCDTIDGQRRKVPPVYDDAPPSPLARQVIEAGGQLILRTTPQADSRGIPFGDTARPSASLLFVPIRDGARVVGILSIQSYTPNAYCSEDLELIQSLADHCSGALDRIQAAEAMRESEARFRQLAENINEVFWITDPAKSQILYLSPAYEAIWGRFCASVLESPGAWLEAIHPEDRDRVLEAALTKQLRGEYDETYRITRPDGSVRWIRDRAFPLRNAEGTVYRIVGVAADITQQRNLEHQFRHIQKMESIGQLAAGMAHDFNNVLAVIRGNAELALMDAGDSNGELADFLQQITTASDRAAHLTRQLLMFARKQVVQLLVIDLNEVVGNMTKMLKRVLGEDITLQVSYGSNLSVVLADVGMMEQVIMNLAVNARDAMPEGGRLVISTSDVQVDEGYVQLNPQSTTGGYVCLSVSDTGCGIDREVQARIFDPFFTTKGVGKGTGLGLATVYGIVQQHKGWITVYSEAGHGAIFRLYLPVAGTVAKDKAQRVAEPQVTGGKETILLVEDDAAVRALMRNVLERYDYTVIEAESGVKALKVWETQGDQIALLLTDMVMPDGITGRALAQTIHRLKPTLPVIYTSGYSADVVAKGFKLKEGANFLQKPCAPRMLALAVRQGLDRHAAQSDTISEAES